MVVEPAGSGTASYNLQISGDGEWFPESEPAATKPEGVETMRAAAKATEGEDAVAVEASAPSSAEAQPSAALPAATQPPASASLDSTYADTLGPNGQLALGTLLQEGTENAVTPEQAKALLRLWHVVQGPFGNVSEEERASRRATAETGGAGFGGRPAGAGQGQISWLAEQVIERLTHSVAQ